MSKINDRLLACGFSNDDISNLSDEDKLFNATGLTHYNEDIYSNDWYVPAGVANYISSNIEPIPEPEYHPDIESTASHRFTLNDLNPNESYELSISLSKKIGYAYIHFDSTDINDAYAFIYDDTSYSPYITDTSNNEDKLLKTFAIVNLNSLNVRFTDIVGSVDLEITLSSNNEEIKTIQMPI